MVPSLFIAADQPTYLKKAAQLILESAIKSVQERGRFAIALSGGSTPKKLLFLLAEDYYRSRIPWANTHVFWGDERCVPPDHADSNYKMAREALLSKVSLPPSHVHRIPSEMESPRDAAKAYEQELKLFFKFDRPFPKFDFMMLGVGEDGHTASLFPGTVALVEQEKWVVANFVEKLSAYRITMTFPVINHSRRIVVLCEGESKAGIVKEIFRDDLPPLRHPIQRVQPLQGELIWLLDAASASKLPANHRDRALHI